MGAENFYLELGQLSEKSVHSLETSFNNLPKSDYLDGAYRLRRFSHFNFNDGQLAQLPTKAFSQDAGINEFQGNVVREYQEIETSVVSSHAFQEMFKSFKAMANFGDEAPIEVHQIRILGHSETAVEAAPEGVHQDGNTFLAVFVIARTNIEGGEICVHPTKEQAPIFKHAFDKGEFVVLNDERFWHSAGALKALDKNEAYMDLFVLTVKT